MLTRALVFVEQSLDTLAEDVEDVQTDMGFGRKAVTDCRRRVKRVRVVLIKDKVLRQYEFQFAIVCQFCRCRRFSDGN